MKILSLILLICLSISCSKNEHGSKDKKAGVTPQGNMPTTGSYNTCDHEDVIYGSFAYIVGNYNIKLIWNRYRDVNHSKYNQVVVMDRHGNTFKSPLVSNTHFVIHNQATDENGYRLVDTVVDQNGKVVRKNMYLQPGDWYWIDIYSYDSYGKPSYGHKYQHIKRGKDIQLNYGEKKIEAGFCSYRPHGF